MALCSERSLVKHDGGTLEVSTLRCRCWSCDHCAPKRARDLRWKARNGDPTLFLTLTIRRGLYETPAAQAVALAKGWRMLRQYLCRLLGRDKIPFLCVIEKHKSGWPHMHLLLRTPYIDHRLIREWWVGRFNSPMVWIEAVHDQRKAAVYVSKYMAKNPTAFEGCKRYWCSQDWDQHKVEKEKPVLEQDVYFDTVTTSPTSMARMAWQDGATITWTGDRLRIDGWRVLDRQRWGIS